MLPPLNPEKFNALASPGDDAGCSSIEQAKTLLALEDDLAIGLVNLLSAWRNTFVPLFDYGKRESEKELCNGKWCIRFKNIPFKSVCLRPRGPSPNSIIDIYAHDKRLESFQILDCPLNWQALVKWLWNYGNKRLLAREKYEASQLRNKFRNNRQRAEKSLLRQVMYKAGIKAQREMKSKAIDLPPIAEEKDSVLDDTSVANPTPRNALDTVDPNAQPEISLQVKGVSDGQETEGVAIEDTDIGGLDDVDHKT